MKKKLYQFQSLTDFHRMFGLPKPVHPLVSLIRIEDMKLPDEELPEQLVLDFYKIAYKDSLGKARYGQHYYDFGEGGMVFTSPGQIFEKPGKSAPEGFIVLLHPDFLWSYPLAQKIQQYGFFSYLTDEALHLSEKEKETVFSVFRSMEEELEGRIDDFSHDVVISQIELLLNYSSRFYKRQFITRKPVVHGVLQQFEALLDDYFFSGKPLDHGVPTVHYFADRLNMSAAYLSDLLRTLTGQNTQQHIHNRLLEEAKKILSTTGLSVSEIAFQLGFEHPQSFSRLFKTKMNLSPLEFRQSFN